jgi:RNA ligase
MKQMQHIHKMKQHISFPSIPSFPNLIRDLKKHSAFKGIAIPNMTFTGTVKLHGTTGSIVRTMNEGEYAYRLQSRNRIISLQEDNMGFARFIDGLGNTVVADFVAGLASLTNNIDEILTVFGEFCGGNVQKHVALTQLPFMFVVFALRVGDAEHGRYIPIPKTTRFWEEMNSHRLYDVRQFGTFEETIDFNDPDSLSASKARIDVLTAEVDAACPAGLYLGVRGHGEGIVWISDNPKHVFKSKGTSHTPAVKEKGKEKKKAGGEGEGEGEGAGALSRSMANDLVMKRVEQALEQDTTKTPSIGEFMRWLKADITKEDMEDIKESGIPIKLFWNDVMSIGRTWYNQRVLPTVDK